LRTGDELRGVTVEFSTVGFPEIEDAGAGDEAAALVVGVRVVGTEFLVLSLRTGDELRGVTGVFSTVGRVDVLAGVVCPFGVFMGVLFLPTIGI
jgi:hypothetical protein